RDVRVIGDSDADVDDAPVRQAGVSLEWGAKAHVSGYCSRSAVPNTELTLLVGIDRIVHFRPRTIFAVLGILLAVGVVLYVLWVARHVLSWLLIALFLTLALNPAVEFLQRHGVRRRGFAAGITFLVALAAVAGLGALFVPTLVDQVDSFANKVPDYVHDLTQGRGRLGFLETRYHI